MKGAGILGIEKGKTDRVQMNEKGNQSQTKKT